MTLQEEEAHIRIEEEGASIIKITVVVEAEVKEEEDTLKINNTLGDLNMILIIIINQQEVKK